jgi:hypothetical protein
MPPRAGVPDASRKLWIVGYFDGLDNKPNEEMKDDHGANDTETIMKRFDDDTASY